MSLRPDLVQPRKIKGQIAQVLTTSNTGRLGFISASVERLQVDLEGIVDNRHRGWTRPADARVPYLPRGATIRNDRHVSVVSIEDLVEIAHRLDIPELNPAWLGANVVVTGLPHLSFLPRGTHLFPEGGAVLTVTDQNAPCTLAGASLVRHIPSRPDLQQRFAEEAQGLRGVVAAVEHPGTIRADTGFVARLPAQWIYA